MMILMNMIVNVIRSNIWPLESFFYIKTKIIRLYIKTLLFLILDVLKLISY